jgi:hypothetical protein
MSGPVQFSFANSEQAAPQAVRAGFNSEESVEAAGEVALGPSPARVGRLRSQARATSPKNVVALAKARLREVKSEIRRLKALEKERDELTRLIEAAESKPRAVVREIKRTAG